VTALILIRNQNTAPGQAVLANHAQIATDPAAERGRQVASRLTGPDIVGQEQLKDSDWQTAHAQTA
jgi:hypothetical protein